MQARRAERGASRSAPGYQAPPTAVACTSTDLQAGEVAASLYSHTVPARWILAGRDWWPSPRAVTLGTASARWHEARCRECGQYEARLVATRTIPAGTELTVPLALTPDRMAALRPYVIFYDGSATPAQRTGNSGAAALLWRIESFGPPTCVARAVMALPGVGSAPLAESHAGALALSLLVLLAQRETNVALRACLIGDCLSVARYGAAQMRFRDIARRQPIDSGLAAAHEYGWDIQWQVIPRRLNQDAHDLARCAVRWALLLSEQAAFGPQVHTEWRSPAPVGSPIPLPQWPSE